MKEHANDTLEITHETDQVLAEVNAALHALALDRDTLKPMTRAAVHCLMVHLEAERDALARAVARMRAALETAQELT